MPVTETAAVNEAPMWVLQSVLTTEKQVQSAKPTVVVVPPIANARAVQSEKEGNPDLPLYGDDLIWRRVVEAGDLDVPAFELRDFAMWTVITTVFPLESSPADRLSPRITRVESNSRAATDLPGKLGSRILTELNSAELERAGRIQAGLAAEDALRLLQHNALGGEPNVWFSEDGILTLQWQKGEVGVALLFAGDGVASLAFRRPGHLYAENGIEVSADSELPQSFTDAYLAVLS